MNVFYEWVKNIACFLCVFNVMLHLISKNSYKRYIRFVGGILLVILVMSPIVDFVNLKGSFDQAFRVEGLKEELNELESARSGLSELHTGKIEEAFKEELKRQISIITEAHGYQLADLKLKLAGQKETFTGLEQITAIITDTKGLSGIYVDEVKSEEKEIPIEIEEIKKEIGNVYQISLEHINIVIRE